MFQLSSPLGFGGRKATSSPATPNYFLKYEIVKNNYLNFFSAGIYDIEAGRSSSFGETHTSHSSLTQVCDFFFYPSLDNFKLFQRFQLNFEL